MGQYVLMGAFMLHTDCLITITHQFIKLWSIPKDVFNEFIMTHVNWLLGLAS